ncbi:MAG TPA: alanyl-tRNA editing protein [Chloroflexota bacterium]|nr:alanyl-tRNA editing protein [Chloroflexota bacterium]
MQRSRDLTQLLYLDDSYDTEFDATVVERSDTGIVLDRTLFYARAGGQMGDFGRLESDAGVMAVVGTEKRDGEVWHVTESNALRIGDGVHGRIDWSHRYQQMRTHTALHILCGVVFHKFRSTVTGCQMYPDRARMDFTLEDLSAERVTEIERLSNDAVKAGHSVRSRWMSRAEAERIPDLVRTRVSLLPPELDPIRVVEIVGVDLQADGGTHVRNTFEVGGITISKTENKGAANKRIEIVLPELLD